MSILMYTVIVAIITLVATSGVMLWLIWVITGQEQGESPGTLALCLSFLLFLVWPLPLAVIWLISMISEALRKF